MAGKLPPYVVHIADVLNRGLATLMRLSSI